MELVGQDVLIHVIDNGIGIAREQLNSIFMMFMQVDTTGHRSQGGLGIGLALVRDFVHMHGGRVEAFSEGPGKGSEFVVRLTVATPEPQTNAKSDLAASNAIASRRILVVDDNHDAANSLAMLMRLRGHQVHVAYSGSDALQIVSENKLDLAFVDIGMPQMDGHEVARRIRSDPLSNKLRLIALTGWGSDADRRRTAQAGFDLHLVKPVDPQLLNSILDGNSNKLKIRNDEVQG